MVFVSGLGAVGGPAISRFATAYRRQKYARLVKKPANARHYRAWRNAFSPKIYQSARHFSSAIAVGQRRGQKYWKVWRWAAW